MKSEFVGGDKKFILNDFSKTEMALLEH